MQYYGVSNVHCLSEIRVSWAMTMIYLISWVASFTDAKTNIGYAATYRSSEDSVTKAVLLVDPSMKALEAGILVGWNIYTSRGRRSQVIALQVWRPVNAEARQYELVGETIVTALWAGHSFIPLRPEDRIHVQEGDTLGLYFPRYNPIPWSQVPCSGGNEHLFKYNPHRLLKNSKDIRFDVPPGDWKPCRQYSFNGTLMSEKEMANWDADYEDTTNTRYADRPYGKLRATRDPYLDAASSTSPSFLFTIIFTILISGIWCASG